MIHNHTTLYPNHTGCVFQNNVDILLNIMRFLPHFECEKMGLVCKSFSEASKNSAHYLEFFFRLGLAKPVGISYKDCLLEKGDEGNPVALLALCEHLCDFLQFSSTIQKIVALIQKLEKLELSKLQQLELMLRKGDIYISYSYFPKKFEAIPQAFIDRISKEVTDFINIDQHKAEEKYKNYKKACAEAAYYGLRDPKQAFQTIHDKNIMSQNLLLDKKHREALVAPCQEWTSPSLTLPRRTAELRFSVRYADLLKRSTDCQRKNIPYFQMQMMSMHEEDPIDILSPSAKYELLNGVVTNPLSDRESVMKAKLYLAIMPLSEKPTPSDRYALLKEVCDSINNFPAEALRAQLYIILDHLSGVYTTQMTSDEILVWLGKIHISFAFIPREEKLSASTNYLVIKEHLPLGQTVTPQLLLQCEEISIFDSEYVILLKLADRLPPREAELLKAAVAKLL